MLTAEDVHTGPDNLCIRLKDRHMLMSPLLEDFWKQVLELHSRTAHVPKSSPEIVIELHVWQSYYCQRLLNYQSLQTARAEIRKENV